MLRRYYSAEKKLLNNMQQESDIVIQDYLLEGMNGIEVLKRAKKIKPEYEFNFLRDRQH
jgi:DNA-binding NarL/FixJ family response regulator